VFVGRDGKPMRGDSVRLGGGLFAELDVPAGAAQVQMPGVGQEFVGGAAVGRPVFSPAGRCPGEQDNS